MKCRNIDENDNSSIFFNSKGLQWPSKIVFDVWADRWDRHTTIPIEFHYDNEEDTYVIDDIQLTIAGDEEYPVKTSPFDIILLGKNRNDSYTYWPKDVYNLLYIESFDGDGARIDRCCISVYSKDNILLFSTELPVYNNEVVEEYEHSLPCSAIRQDNYVSDGKAVRTALVQKLSLLKNELWFSRQFGLPLLEKSSKGIFDSYIARVINNQFGVKSISSFKSFQERHDYSVDVLVESVYGSIPIELQY